MQQGVKYNGLAIAGFVVSLCSLILPYYGIVAIVGLVLSVVGKNQIAVTGEGGRGMAIAGLVIGIVSLAWAVIAMIACQSALNTLLTNFTY